MLSLPRSARCCPKEKKAAQSDAPEPSISAKSEFPSRHCGSKMNWKSEYPGGPSTIEVETHGATRVKVRANVVDLVSVDSSTETFTAIFTLHFFWIDPALANYEGRIVYRPKRKKSDETNNGGGGGGGGGSGSVNDSGSGGDGGRGGCPREAMEKEVRGTVVGYPGYNERKTLLIRSSAGSGENGEGGSGGGQFFELPKTRVLWVEQPDWAARGGGGSKRDLGDDDDAVLPGRAATSTNNSRYFSPKWSIRNQVGDLTTMFFERELQYVSAKGGHVFEKHKYQGTFSHRLVLWEFPFDRQVFRIRFTAEDDMGRIQFAPLRKAAGHLPSLEDGGPLEWRSDDYPESLQTPAVLLVHRPWPDLLLSNFDILIHLRRDPTFYFWNIIFVLFFITLASALAFLVEPREVADRATVSLTLLLVSVGYKYIMNSWLPVKPYLTFLDKYILLSFTLQFANVVEGFLVVRLFCRAVQDMDADWGDEEGRYAGPPPPYECMDTSNEEE